MIWEIVNCSENLVSEILSQSEDVTIEAVAESMTDLIQEIETTVLLPCVNRALSGCLFTVP